MAREASANDFIVDVEGIGSFSFGKRNMRDEIRIQVEFARMIDGVDPTEWLSLVAGWLSTLKVMTVRSPEGWNVDELDPLDSATYAKLKKVSDALDAKELSFRSKPVEANKAAGEGTV